MKNRLKIITAIMLTLIFCMQPVCNVQATEESNLSEAQQEKKTLENDLQKAKELIDSLKGSKEDIQSEVEKLDKQLNEISGKVKELESRLSKKRQEIADTESALNKAKEQEKKQYRNMKKRIQFMYENGQTSYVEMLLSADSFTDFLNAVEYITQISQYDRKMLKEYQNMQVTIADTQKTLETDYASLQSLQAKVQEEKQAVAALESAKKGDLTDAQTVAKAYEAEIQAQNEVIAQIQAAQKRAAEQQAAQQQAQAAEGNQGATDAAGENQNTAQNTTPSGNGQSTGSMMWPCPSSKRVTSDYGPRTSPTNGASSNHKGIDIGAAYGADIVAADGGTVLVATYSSSGGNYVIIDHGGGLCTVYMHASSLTVSAGQTVSKGQVIAKVGSTGISTGNHLHFGVTLNGVYVSPWGYVS